MAEAVCLVLSSWDRFETFVLLNSSPASADVRGSEAEVWETQTEKVCYDTKEGNRTEATMLEKQELRRQSGVDQDWFRRGGGLEGPTGVTAAHLSQNGSFSSPPLTAGLGGNRRSSRWLR